MTENQGQRPAPTTRDLRNFGLTFAGVAATFALFLWWRGRPSAPWFAGASLAFLLAGTLAPHLLARAHGPWMRFAEILGAVNTKMLLGIFYLVGVTPIGLAMRVFGKDPMARVFKGKGVSSYWTKPTPHVDGTRHFDRQF